jgi:hypothetical protein
MEVSYTESANIMPPLNEQQWTTSTLKIYFDEVFTAKFARIEQMLADRDKALLVALGAIEERAVELNAYHQRTEEKIASSWGHEAHERYASAVAIEIDRIKDSIKTSDDEINTRIAELEKPKWATWISAAMLMCTIVGGLWFLAINPYQQNLTRMETQIEAILQGKNPTQPSIHLR